MLHSYHNWSPRFLLNLTHRFLQKPYPGHLPLFIFYYSPTNSLALNTVASLLHASASECVHLLFWFLQCPAPALCRTSFLSWWYWLRVILSGRAFWAFCIKKKSPFHYYISIYLLLLASWHFSDFSHILFVMLHDMYLSLSVSPTGT